MNVKAWQEKVVIPTYEVGKPEKNPIFLEKRVYQGSSGAVYPHPVIEKIADTRTNKEWQACYLENEYLKIMVLPELGGRVQMAYDKTKERHFVYYNEVIKPALVGLTGPWISGGIEFNWPQHHRPSTYDPVDFTIEENEDGSKTIWCSEIERMYRTRGMAGFTLYPDKAYLEIKVKLFNRTSQPQTFLWWANPAVAVNDHYQSVFPPDVHAVFDHGKRDVSKFPVATGTYYKVDYSRGVDISKYKNIPVPTSYMAIESKYDFVGGYDNEEQGGLLHVANHHISPGKKQWTWGNGDFGKAWDRNLTDRNGPYIELMCGVYTDNQPDFSWLMPYEEKSFSQYFMPYRDLGAVKNATKDVMLNLEICNGTADIRIYSTGTCKEATVELKSGDQLLLKEAVTLDPCSTYLKKLPVDPEIPAEELHLAVYDQTGRLLIEWSPGPERLQPVPDAAKPARDPGEIRTNEELFLNGLHLEQYRHATYDPTDYYKEAIKRDPGDVRSNNAMGMWLLRRGKFEEAGNFFNIARERLIQRNPNPYEGEPLFNLGLALRLMGQEDEAYEHFYKSVWNAAFMDSGYFQLAQIDLSRGALETALEHVNQSLLRNWHNHKARHLKTAILRKRSETDAAFQLVIASLELDKFNFGLYFERYLMGDAEALVELKHLIRGNIHNYIEIALDYAWAGLYTEALDLLDTGIGEQQTVYPMAYYYEAWFQYRKNEKEEAGRAIFQAEQCSPDYCFPHQVEAVLALKLAVKLNPSGARAYYYLGNFWYNARQYKEALDCYTAAARLDSGFPTVFRNLALVGYNKFCRHEEAVENMEKAFALDNTDARILMELNQLYKKVNKTVNFRSEVLEQYSELVDQRDDLYLEKVEIHLLQKQYKEAYDLIVKRKFHPWEGGEGKVSGAYVRSLCGMALQTTKRQRYKEALKYLEMAKVYPENLGEGKLKGAQENQVHYLLGCAYDGLGELENARLAWSQGSLGLSEPSAAWYYNDQQPDTIFYQGLSLMKLGDEPGAMGRFIKLIDYGKQHYFDKIRIDYFAVSLPDLQIWEEDLDKRNQVHCNYLMALGYRGIGDELKSGEYFRKVLEADQSHAGAMENMTR